MPQRYSILCLATLVAALLTGCNKAIPDPYCYYPVLPVCYSGTVVGFECGNGYLIQVDAQYPIGAPLRVTYADSLPRPNIVAAVNRLGAFQTPGQRLYFTYVNDASQQHPQWACTAQNPQLYYSVPHLVLSNLSATACAPGQTP